MTVYSFHLVPSVTRALNTGIRKVEPVIKRTLGLPWMC
jgi:hypothetical protein